MPDLKFVDGGGPIKLGPKYMLPSMTTAERTALTKYAGMEVLDTDLNRVYVVDANLDWKYYTLN